jgi:hypothetical protein
LKYIKTKKLWCIEKMKHAIRRTGCILKKPFSKIAVIIFVIDG